MVDALQREGVSFAGTEYDDDTLAFNASLKLATDLPNTAAEIQLRDAIKDGNMQMVAQIINGRTIDINWVDKQNGFSFLHYAVSSDESLNAVEHLIKAGIDIRKTNKDGKTAFEVLSDKMEKEKVSFFHPRYPHVAGAAKWMIDKGTEEIEKIAKGGMKKVGDFTEANKWLAAGGSIFPLMGKFSLHSVLHLRPEDQVRYVRMLFDDGHKQIREMVESGQIDRKALMGEEVNGVKPYEFFKSMADNEKIDEASRKRFQEIADILKENKAPGSEKPEEDPESAPETEQLVVGPLGPHTQIPKDDKRTAEQIAADSKVYSQLHEKDRKALLEFIGKDVKDERRKVYLAVAVLNHIEHFNQAGDVLVPSGEGVIDGWTRADRTDPKSEAVHGTEAGRFQDFLKYGWGDLKGDSLPNGMPPEFGPPPEELTPSPDEREAQEIVKGSSLLSNLAPNDKKALKTRVGDFDTNPLAARTAIEVLNHIERYDEEGKPIKGGKTIGNGIIDGWTRADRNDPRSEAEHGTEAGRFQDFIKYGWSTLKTETDASKIADIEALEKQADGVGDDYGKFEDFMNQLKEAAYYGIISEAGLPANKRDFIANPDKYSTEERAAAALELIIMRERIGDGIKHYSEYGVVHGTNYYGRGEIILHSDPQKVIDQLNDSIDKLMNDDVASFISDRESEELQEITAKSPKLRQFLGNKAKAMRDDAWGLDHMIEANKDLTGKINRFRDLTKQLDGLGEADTTKREELEDELSKILNEMADPLLGALGAYFAQATTTNIAAGENGNVFDDTFFIDTIDNKYFDVITAAYGEFVQNPAALNNMIKGGMKPEEAIAQLNSRAAIFASFGSNPTELSEHVNANIQNYYFENTKAEELVGIILKEDGSIDEDRLGKIIDKIRADDPESPLINGDNGEKLSNGQIIAAVRNIWDTARGVGKLDFSLSKFWADRRPLSADNPLHKIFAAGGMHLVSGLLAASAMIAKAANGDLSEADIIGTVGSGLQTIGLSGEAWSWTMRDNKAKTQKLTDRWNKTRDNWRAWRGQAKLDPNSWIEGDRPYTTKQIENKITNFKHFMRFAGATGGGMILGASIALGIEELKKGNEAGAAVLFSSGAANAATLLPSYMQSIVPMFTNAQGGIGKWDKVKLDRFIGRIGIIGGATMTVVNAAAFLAVMGYMLYEGIKEDMATEAYFASFTPTLAEYRIDGGGADDPWWDGDDGPTIGS